MIFVDTGAWYARYVSEDVDHVKAVAWFANPADLLVTTDYIVDELLTLLKMRGYSQIAFAVGDKFLSANVCQLEYVQPRDIQLAWSMFSQYRDKDWSFTDCTSRAVMERLKITTACAFDKHFHQFGNITVVPA